MAFKRVGLSEALPFSWALGWKLQEDIPKCWQYPRDSSAAELSLLEMFLLGSVVQGFLFLGGCAGHGVPHHLLHSLWLLYQEIVQHQEMSFPKLSQEQRQPQRQWWSSGRHCRSHRRLLVPTVAQMPFSGPPNAFFTAFLMSLYLVPFSRQRVRPATDNTGGSNPEGHVIEHPLLFLGVLAHSLGSTSESGVDNLGSSTAITPQLLRGAVCCLLGGDDSVDCAHEFFHRVVMDDLNQWGLSSWGWRRHC